MAKFWKRIEVHFNIGNDHRVWQSYTNYGRGYTCLHQMSSYVPCAHCMHVHVCAGMMLVIPCGIVGIPLAIHGVRHVGALLMRAVDRLVSRSSVHQNSTTHRRGRRRSLSALTALFFVSSSLLYSTMEDWTVLQATYFLFVSFTTVGFGDLIPASNVPPKGTPDYRECIAQLAQRAPSPLERAFFSEVSLDNSTGIVRSILEEGMYATRFCAPEKSYPKWYLGLNILIQTLGLAILAAAISLFSEQATLQQ